MISLRHNIAKQQGFAILAMAIMLLMVITIVAIYSSKVVVREHQLDRNVYRSGQAFEAAQAGLDYALVYLNKHKDSIKNGDTVSHDLPDKSSFKATYISTENNNPDPGKFTINVMGQSSDFSVGHIVEQVVARPVSKDPNVPPESLDYAKVIGTWNDLKEQ